MRHDQTTMRKYFKVDPEASVYDPSRLLYFVDRMSMHNNRFKRDRKVLLKQDYRCAHCEIKFNPKDGTPELHHILKDGVRTGKTVYVHGHCHDQVHSKKTKMK